MRIALINSFCKYGSTGKNTFANYNAFKENGHNAKVYYGRVECDNNNPDLVYLGYKYELLLHVILGNLLGLQGSLSFFATRKLIKHLKKFKPELAYFNNLHGHYLNEFTLLRYLKKHNVWIIYDMPDEYPFMGKCCYSYDCIKFQTQCEKCPLLPDYPKSMIFDNSKRLFNAKKRIYNGYERMIFMSAPFVVDKAVTSALIKDKALLAIDSAVDVENLYYPRDSSTLRKKLGIQDDKIIVLNVAPFINPRKGVQYFLDTAKQMENESNIVYINVGFSGDTSSCPKNYIPIEYVSDQNELAEYYSLADLFVCTSIADAMPNACIEALGCGTPLLGFNISGVPYIASSEFGEFVTPLSVDELADAIKRSKKKTPESIKACRNYALSRYTRKLSFDKRIALINWIEQENLKGEMTVNRDTLYKMWNSFNK